MRVRAWLLLLISADAAVGAVLSELGGIFALKEQGTAIKDFLLYAQLVLENVSPIPPTRSCY